jgi:hypothetical protein
MTSLAQHPPATAPRDGRVYRGYFERAKSKGAMFKAVSWDSERGWVDLQDREVGSEWRLSAWTPD